MKKDLERRHIRATELRAVDENGVRHIVGYAAVFNSLSEDLGGFRERIAPGSFARALKEDDVRALMNHNSDFVLGRNKSGTLTLEEDSHGLKIDCVPPDTQWARDLLVSIERGDIDQMSFGFCVRWYPNGSRGVNWTVEDGEDIRTLTDVELFDVSPVTYPAYPDTQVAVRSHESWKESAAPSSGGQDTTVSPSIDTRTLRKKMSLKKNLEEMS